MFKKIFLFYYKNEYSKFPILLSLILIVGLFELVGIGLFVPLLDNSDNIINDFVNSFFSLLDIKRDDLSILTFLFFIFIFKFFVIVVFNNKLTFHMNNFVFNIRNNMVQYISKMRFQKVREFSIGELNNLITKESEKLSEGYGYTLLIILRILLTIVYITLSFMINIYATLLAIVIGFLFILGFKKIVNLSRVYSIEMLSSNEKTNSYINEFLHGIKYLFATNSFFNINRHLELKLYTYSMAKYKLDYYGKLSKEIPEPVGVMIIIIILMINYLYMGNSMMSVLMSSFLLYKTFKNIAGLQYLYQKIMGVSASIIKVKDFNNKLFENIENNGKLKVNNIEKIKFRELVFKFNNHLIINKISCEFKKGQTYAFVGNSGAGKTTILNILCSLYEVNDNSYFINNFDSLKIDKYDFRKKIGYVSQEPLFFDGSIRDNITLYNNYNNSEINDIITKVKLTEVVKEKSLDNRLQSFGKDLSGGQLQRINIARELIKKPEILILDESTSALDANVEKNIMDEILSLKNDMIIIIVAHRLSTLINVDEILYLEGGKIKNKGSMEILYKLDKTFKKMCNNQNIFLGQEID